MPSFGAADATSEGNYLNKTFNMMPSASVTILLCGACSALALDSSASASPVLPRAQEVVLGGGAGAAYRLGVERLRQPPYDSVDFLRADLSHELKRLFTNFSGDMSGRYIEIATLTAAPHD